MLVTKVTRKLAAALENKLCTLFVFPVEFYDNKTDYYVSISN